MDKTSTMPLVVVVVRWKLVDEQCTNADQYKEDFGEKMTIIVVVMQKMIMMMTRKGSASLVNEKRVYNKFNMCEPTGNRSKFLSMATFVCL